MKAASSSGDRLSPAVRKRRLRGGGWLLLGPHLSVFQVDRLPTARAPMGEADLQLFRQLGLIVPAALPPAPARAARRGAPERALLPRFTGLVVVHPSARGRAAAALLTRALTDVRGAFTAATPAVLRKAPAGSLVIWMGQTEPTAPREVVEPLLRRGLRVLWCGESTAGLQVGPIFETVADVQRYSEATAQRGTAEALRRLGFREAWPLSLLDRTLADPRPVARAIRRVIVEPRSCVLLPSNRKVMLWTEVRSGSVPYAELKRRQTWPKGLLADLTVERLPGGAFMATCATPCRGIASLEGCNGKGLDRRHALLTATGEAIERFSAAEVGLHLTHDPPAPSAYPLSAFHPREDRRYEAHLLAGSPDLAGYPAVDELTGRQTRVPECLVPFPYLPPRNRPAFSSDTAGLAAFPDRDGAILRGASEILERNNFYPHFLHQRPALQLGAERGALGPRVADLVARLERRLPARVWLLEYPEAHRLPIVHAFLLDLRAGHMSRGTGAGGSLAHAAERALLEALMTRAQHEHLRQNPELRAEPGFRDWAHPATVRALAAYLERQPRAASTSHPAPDDAALLDRIKAFLRAAEIPLLVADLPCPVQGWSAVRVLLPGMTCHAHPSRSAGGRVLLDAPLRVGIPT
ncbi:YcaO-like family protein [Chondromyces apiculatus]|uniref:YcaO domain-containing protein n=1 Tax=Chondromyces apiculatus DSM 436 TaxID=1192034 RepID=A0A017T6F8_9BACT|nr:YcaO-like family protein [Chondromyces apiculatus]EYF04572.1 Hypothetical protein CAP_4392 [Chondromyces apiculatus DSM 436]